MAKLSLSTQLDDLVQALLTSRDSAPHIAAQPEARLTPLASIAADLRGLPHEAFKAHLKSDLQGRISMSAAIPAVQPIREGFHSVTLYLIVPGAPKFIDFVKEAFGAKEILRVKRPAGDIMHAEVRIGDSMLEMAEATDHAPRIAALHLYVKDADATYQRALQAGATSLHAPVDQPYGDREAGVRDAFGNMWFIATHQATGHAPEGMHTLTPYLFIPGAARMIDFLKNAFGAEEASRVQSPEGVIAHASVRIGDSMIEMSDARDQYQPMQSGLHFYVANTDAMYQRAVRAGAKSIQAPADQPYGDRMAWVDDPFGNNWFIATHIKDVQF